ncbi:MAG: hypothetical protein EBZ14_10440 [Gammaproteobacteria bacterium]|nr:hypothetical protein [Gammaproteobacteria bacterium]
MQMLARFLKFGAAASIILLIGALALGDYVYRAGTAVHCGVHSFHAGNTPSRFQTPGVGEGPFRGEGWNQWVDHDLSRWWLSDVPFESVRILDPNRPVSLAAWWMTPSYPRAKETVIVVHGINSSRHNFDTLMPAAMLARAGFNVLLMDLRDQGETTCEDGRHSAGQDESDDIITAAYWLKSMKAIPLSKIGVHGVSGGALAAIISAAKNTEIAAFSLEAPVFDFNRAATDEVRYQGFPGELWRAAYWAARIRGIDLMRVRPADGINALKGRPAQVLHGDADSRVAYQNALDLTAYAASVGEEVALHTFSGADHIEGLLREPERYQDLLVRFFTKAL